MKNVAENLSPQSKAVGESSVEHARICNAAHHDSLVTMGSSAACMVAARTAVVSAEMQAHPPWVLLACGSHACRMSVSQSQCTLCRLAHMHTALGLSYADCCHLND
jgi:hypothetical protein